MKEKITAKNWIQNMNSYTIVYIKCLSVYWNLQHEFHSTDSCDYSW